MSATNWFCRKYAHAHLAEFKGSPEEERMALESHEFLHSIEPALEFVLKLTAPSLKMSLLDAMPTLSLFFNQPYQRGDNPATEADRPRMLQAFGKLMAFSDKLNAFPRVKTAFWVTMATSMCGYEAKNMHKQVFGLPQFPQFAVDCGRQRYGRWSNVNEALCDAVFEFMTTPAEGTPSSDPRPLGLSFAYDEPTLERTREQLELIERMLDSISTSPTQQYKLTVLDFSNSIMNAPELEVVARIAAKCKSGFYQIEQLQLDAVIPNIGMSGYHPGETPREFLDITTATFSAAALPQFWSFRPPLDLPVRVDAAPSKLRKVSFDRNVFTQGFFSEHFSTLRYGCPLEEDLTNYFIGTRHHEQISVDCWRWLAFGLFYPRPKRFADAYKLRTIGKLALDPIAIRTIVDTIRNPVAQLVHADVERADTSTTDCLMVCTVKEGAEIEVFVCGRKVEIYGTNQYQPAYEPWTKTLLETSEFEALCEREDGSVCVVVPGAGLGWVAKEDIVLLEREPLDLARSAHDGLYHMTIGASENKTHVGDLQPLFNAMGRQLRSLTLDFNLRVRGINGAYTFDYASPVQETAIQFVRDHCVHLRHLNMNGASRDEFSDLVTALSSTDLGSRLLTLKLNENDRPADVLGYQLVVMNLNENDDSSVKDIVVHLASVLASTERPLALGELRLNHCAFSLWSLRTLYDALTANRTLQLVELRRAAIYPNEAELRQMEDRLDVAFQSTPLSHDAATPSEESESEGLGLPNTGRMVAWSEDFRRH